MSVNNQLVICKNKKGEFCVHENFCVDNDFKPSKSSLLKKCKTLQEAIKFGNKFCREEIVEYGTIIDDNCLGVGK